MDSASDSDDSSDIEDIHFERVDQRLKLLTELVKSTRVLDPGEGVPKNSHLPLYLEGFHKSDTRRFRGKLRMEPHVFDTLVDLIKDDEVFNPEEEFSPQFPVQYQLAIFLMRAGHYGSASSSEAVAQWAGVSLGTVINATHRVMVAILRMHDQVIRPASSDQKEKAKEYVERETCPEWRDGYLNADGTKIPLFTKPGFHGEAYFDKNKDYSLDLQVIIFYF
jgi:hypothetical protein